MPVRTNGAAAGSKRFELPALDLQLGSLTEGTDIPPPLPSPIEEKKPVPKTPVTASAPPAPAASGVPATTAATTTIIESPESHVTKGTTATTDAGAASPSASSRPGSIRRLFSRNLLNNAYDGAPDDHSHHRAGERPGSRTNGSIVTDGGFSGVGGVTSKKAKRSSGWFNRIRASSGEAASDGGGGGGGGGAINSNSNKRVSLTVLPTGMASKSSFVDDKRVPLSPPPPMIPELSELKSKIDVDDGGSLGGDDLFKDIK